MSSRRGEKMRQPDNLPTWSVITGCLLGVLFVLGSAYSQRLFSGLLVFVLIVAYIGTLTFVGHVNVLRILWGETVDEESAEGNQSIVVTATIVMAVIALLWWMWNLVSDDSWGWFGWIGAGVALAYLIFALRDAQTSEEDGE